MGIIEFLILATWFGLLVCAEWHNDYNVRENSAIAYIVLTVLLLATAFV